MIPTLHSKRLTLRPICREDAPRIQQVFPCMEVMEFLNASIPWPYPEDGAEEFLNLVLPEMSARSRFIWAITLTAANDNNLIGIIEISPDGPCHRGFWLMPEHHKNGYMTEAVTAVNDFAFKVLEMPVMRLSNALPNIGSRKLKERSGAVLVEIKPEGSFVGGMYPEEIWELTAEEWWENRANFLTHIHKHLG